MEKLRNIAAAFSTIEQILCNFTIQRGNVLRFMVKRRNELGTENFDDTCKQALCRKLEQLVSKLDSTHSETIRIVKSDTATDWLTVLNKSEGFHRGMLRQYQKTASVEIKHG